MPRSDLEKEAARLCLKMKPASTPLACAVGVLLLFMLLFVDIWNPSPISMELRRGPPVYGSGEGVLEDKLLGGLLASGFDEESCLSRYRSGLYRKISPHKPSSYLLSRLRKYEHLHKLCGPVSSFYNQTSEILRPGKGNSSSKADCKYVVMITRDGLGNRILSLASAFLYALLTDRLLLLDQGNGLSDLFCEPFPNSSWLLPWDFPLRDQFHAFPQTYGGMLKNNISFAPSEPPPSHLYIYLAHDSSDHDKLFYCDQQQAFLKGVPWLTMNTNNYFVPALFLVPSFEQELSKLFPRKDTVFHLLGRYLFHPSNDVWGLITRFYEAYLAKAKQKVGIQIRTFGSESDSSQHHMDQILACTLKEKLLPEVDMERSNITSPSKNRKVKAVLITSLDSQFSKITKNIYWEHPTVNGDTVGVFQPSSEEFQMSEEKMHNRKAWAEMYLLSLTDVLVTSAWSTFGYVAQGLAGLMPWILYKPEAQIFVQEWAAFSRENETTHSSPCGRAVSMEPCLHAPPVCDCGQMRRIDTGSIVPYVTHCEDMSWGLKLVHV